MSQLKQALVNSIVTIMNDGGLRAVALAAKHSFNATDVSTIRRGMAMEVFTLDKVVRIAGELGVTFSFQVGEPATVLTTPPVEPIKVRAAPVEPKTPKPKRMTKAQQVEADKHAEFLRFIAGEE